ARAANPLPRLIQKHLVAAADGILEVRPERGNPPEAVLLVQADGRLLVDARLESEQRDAVAASVRSEVIDELLAVFTTAKFGPHVHAFELAVFFPDEHDAATPGRAAVDAQNEERYTLGHQLVHAEPMAALGRVEWFEVGLQVSRAHGCV